MDKQKLAHSMIRRAESRLGETKYAGWHLSFIEDALETANDIVIFRGGSAKESAELYADGMR